MVKTYKVGIIRREDTHLLVIRGNMLKHPKYNVFLSKDGKVFDEDREELKVFPSSNKTHNSYREVYLKELQVAKSIHRLVAETYLDNPENKRCVNHLDGLKCNNNLYNLEWATDSENHLHAFSTGLRKSGVGENASYVKHTNEQVHEVCRLLQEGVSNTDIEDITGFNKKLVSNIKKGESWGSISKGYNIVVKRWSQLNKSLVHEICKSIIEGLSNKSIAENLSVKPSQVSDIRNKRSNKKISDTYWV